MTDKEIEDTLYSPQLRDALHVLEDWGYDGKDYERALLLLPVWYENEEKSGR